MQTVMDPGEVATVATRGSGAATPLRLTTTLYALMAALQAVVAPDDDARVVATVMHLLRSRRLTWLGTDSMRRGPSRRQLRPPRPRGSPRAAAARAAGPRPRGPCGPGGSDEDPPHVRRGACGWQLLTAGVSRSRGPDGIRQAVGPLSRANGRPVRLQGSVTANHMEGMRGSVQATWLWSRRGSSALRRTDRCSKR